MMDRQMTNLGVTNKAKTTVFGQFIDGNATLPATIGATVKTQTQHLSMTQTSQPMFLKTKFQVGSCKSDKINFSQCEKVFHSGDIPESVLNCKKSVMKSKQSNILGTSTDPWNFSSSAQPRLTRWDGSSQYSGGTSLKRTLQKVRAGLMDQKTMKDSKHLSEEKLAERIRYVVGITGKGPIGKFVGKWWNARDERGLPAHCINPDWPDLDASTAVHTTEDVKQAEGVFLKREERRLRMNVVDEHVNYHTYDSLIERYHLMARDVEDKKIQYQDLKDLFKHELRIEFPTCSEERLQSMAQRLLDEKLLSDVKLKRFPVQHESFRPNLSLTTQNRKFKQYYHPGSWTFIEKDGRFAWSCCMNYKEDSKGCAFKVCNPDKWCVEGFERAGLRA